MARAQLAWQRQSIRGAQNFAAAQAGARYGLGVGVTPDVFDAAFVLAQPASQDGCEYGIHINTEV